jgi:hypothetical protein
MIGPELTGRTLSKIAVGWVIVIVLFLRGADAQNAGYRADHVDRCDPRHRFAGALAMASSFGLVAYQGTATEVASLVKRLARLMLGVDGAASDGG